MVDTEQKDWTPFWKKRSYSLYALVKDSFSKKFAQLITENKSKGKVLEAGCGEGKILYHLKNSHHVFGLDYSWLACTKTKDLIDCVVNGDNFFLPFKTDVFDVVFNQGIIHTISQPREMLQEMLRVTKKNGIVLFSVPKKKSLFPLIGGFWPIKQKYYTQREFRELLSRLPYPSTMRNFWYGQLFIGIIKK